MTSFKQGDVVLVQFIFSEGTAAKKRPALVMSSQDYHRSRQEVLIAAITSNTERVLAGDTKIHDWKRANLLFPSLVTGIIQTIKSQMIERVLGSLGSEDFRKVQDNLRIILGLR